ncbi:hypothetical protein [Lactiplantibacillus mudanjiangensis]|uniref:hypothetical protein n=1 Tax=Lactiplantibacillus mudanjiangensis TaxID=1296538 RepID=UPI00102FC0E2
MNSDDRETLIIPESPQKRLLDSIDLSSQVQIFSALKRAYLLADATMHDDNSSAKWLSSGRGDFALESRIRQIAVECELCRLIEKGKLPFDYAYKFNDRKNYKYLIINKKGEFHMTVNQCVNGNQPAKKVKYRESENTNFQTRLVLDNDDMIDEYEKKDEYFELNHGYRTVEPKFAYLGIPMMNSNKWAYRLNLVNNLDVLSAITQTTEVSGPKPITPDEFAAYQKRESND